MQLNLLAFLLSPVECLLCIGAAQSQSARDTMNAHPLHYNHDSLSYLRLVDVTSSLSYASNAATLKYTRRYYRRSTTGFLKTEPLCFDQSVISYTKFNNIDPYVKVETHQDGGF